MITHQLMRFRRAAVVLGSVLALVMVLGIVPMIGAQGLPAISVYGDGLASGWENWSWNTTINLNSTNPVRSGSAALAARYDQAWAGIYLRRTTAVPDGYQILRFWINGGSGGQSIQVGFFDQNSAPTMVTSIQLSANTWQQVDVPLDAVGSSSSVWGVVWQDAKGSAQPIFYIDDVEFISTGPAPTAIPQNGITLTVDAGAGRRNISPLIYGMNFADAALAADIRLTVNRWGGNATTRYNWRQDSSNRGSDWFFENIPDDNNNPGALPNGSAADRFVSANKAVGSETIMTVPLIGWTPNSRAIQCAFSVTKYGPQQQVDPYRPDCGNGVRPDGSFVTGNDPRDTSTAIEPSFVQDWVRHLNGQFGSAGNGGVQFYNLDNEPALWNSTHRDVHPSPLSYDELRDRTYAYAAAIKAVDPNAQTLGPVEWGWTGYFYSALDAAAGGTWWNNPQDRNAHGGMALSAWYLEQMRLYEAQYGVRILDYFDLHYYPQGQGVALSGAGNASTQALRLRSTRSLWDASYVDESWINEPVRLIPRMREWIAQYYPGTKIAITEYNFGAVDHINGALAQADVLGIFGREGVDLATMWAAPTFGQPAAYAFRIYRNYDGAGSGFGETSVQASSSDQGQLSIYAAERQDGALTIVVINKTGSDQISTLTLNNFAAQGTAHVYRYSGANLGQIAAVGDANLNGNSLSSTYPAQSISLLVIPAGAGNPSDTPVPPSATPEPPPETATPTAEVSGARLVVAVQAGGTAVGEPVQVELQLQNLDGLYGLQVDCAVDATVLGSGIRGDGDVFTNSNSFVVDGGYQSDGTWSIGASLLNPTPAFSGNGVAFRLGLVVAGAGSSAVNCTALAVNLDGDELPLSVVNGYWEGVSGGETATPETPTAIPSLTPTPEPATSTPTAEPATATPEASSGTLSGHAAYEKRNDQSGITVQVLVGGTAAGSVVTNGSGAYVFTGVPEGAYVVMASAAGHLSAQIEALSGTTAPLIVLVAGDADGNGVIDLIDASYVGANYSIQAPPAPSQVDFNGDQIIDLMDLVLVGKNFGKTATSVTPPATPVPTVVVNNGPRIGNCPVFPADNPWNQVVTNLPVHPNSANYIASINANRQFLHADFGENPDYGIPFVEVGAGQPMVPITFTAYGDESDPGPYPIPANAPVEGGSDRHVLAVDSDNCMLYELFNAAYNGTGWNADSGAVFNLLSNQLRPLGWTSADAAGLPIFPGLVRYDEVEAGAILHALRFTVQRTQRAFILPATHFASSSTDPNLPPMGLRLRLRADYDISSYTGMSRVILEALKTYGMILADNGSSWFISGATDPRWNDDDLNQLKRVPGSAFEAVDTGALITEAQLP